MPKKKKKRSINIPTQLRHRCPACEFLFWHYIPYGDEALEKSKEHALYQILESKFTGTKRGRSITQLGLYWKCCATVTELLSDHNNQFIDKEIDFEVKIRVGKKHTWMIKRFKSVGGIVYIEPISISFQNLDHLEANKFFDKGFKELAGMVEIDEDELVEQAKARMRGKHPKHRR